jgi:hypothetical protein
MSKHEEAALILKLYELRRETTIRQARDCILWNSIPSQWHTFRLPCFGPHSAHLHGDDLLGYGAALVNHGAISAELFNDTNGEYIGVFPRLNHCCRKPGPSWVRNFSFLWRN